MADGQLDLFADVEIGVEDLPRSAERSPPAAIPVGLMTDLGLIAAIPESSLDEACNLSAEAGRRRLATAVPGLAALCRRLAGFGAHRQVPEQAAAIEALAMIGGLEAAHAVSEMIERSVVQGPTLQVAATAAARLGASLSPATLRRLLTDVEPAVRAHACRCARPLPELILILIDLVGDLDRRVARSAALALARMGRAEALPIVKDLLRNAPSEEVIGAAASLIDDDCAVLLGRIARSGSAVSEAALLGLEDADHPRAAAIADAVRRLRPQASDPVVENDHPRQSGSR